MESLYPTAISESRGSWSKILRPAGFYRMVWAFVIAAAIFRFCFLIPYSKDARALRSPEALRVGLNLHRTGDWVNPFSKANTGPTAHVAPGFPFVVASLYGIFGEGAGGAYAVAITEALVLTIQIALLPVIAMKLGADRLTALISAMIALLGTRRNWLWEANYAGFLLVLAALATCTFIDSLRDPQRESDNRSSSPVLIASTLGLLWGLLFLFHPGTAPVWLAWLVLCGVYAYQRGALYKLAPALLIPLIVVAPWTWRNHKVLHSWIFVRSNLGLELQTGANPCAGATIFENRQGTCFRSIHPNENTAEAMKLAQMGEVEYNRAKLKQALAWIEENPGKYSTLAAKRFVYFWFPTETDSLTEALTSPRTRLSAWVVYSATLLSLPGLFLLWRKSPPGAILCGSALALFPIIHYLVQYENRYRYPILWLTFILASVAIREGIEKFTGRTRFYSYLSRI